MADGLTDALDELRELARGIHPAILSERGLAPALKALARRSAVPAINVALPRLCEFDTVGAMGPFAGICPLALHETRSLLLCRT